MSALFDRNHDYSKEELRDLLIRVENMYNELARVLDTERVAHRENIAELEAKLSGERAVARGYMRERDDHRRALNRIADRLHVVYEDPKILAAFEALLVKYEELGTHNRNLTSLNSTYHTRMRILDDKLGLDHETFETYEKRLDELRAKELDSSDLQLACLALAECMLRRPGFEHAITELAKKLGGDDGLSYLTAFRQTSADIVKPLGSLLDPKSGG